MDSSVLLVAIAWVVYFFVHSLSASESFKGAWRRRFPRLWPRNRLLYNIFATVSLLGPLGTLGLMDNTDLLVSRPPVVGLGLDALRVCAIAAMIWSARRYNIGAFTGLRPVIASARTVSDDDAPLNVSGFNRYVRHPWYAFALIIVWSRPLDIGWLISAKLTPSYQLRERC